MTGPSRAEFVEFVRAAEFAVLATASPQGRPEAALLGVAVSPDGKLVMDVPDSARKLANLRDNDRVAVVIGWEAGVSFQIEGTARLVTGAERARYETVYTQRFPGSRVTDPAFAVIVVTPNWIRRYDATADPPLVQEADWPDHQATVSPR